MRGVPNKMIVNHRNHLLTALILLNLLPGLSSALQLREIDSMPLKEVISIYGQSGNIMLLSETKLTLFDRNRRVQSEIDLDSGQTPIVSANGLFYGIVEGFTPGEADSSIKVATIFDNRQSPLWGDYNLIDGEYYLSPSGEYFVALSGTKGEHYSRMFLYHKDNPTIEHDIRFFEDILFSDDGRYFLIDSGPRGIRLFSADGTPIRTFGSQKRYAFSRNGNWLALFNQGILKVFENCKERFNLDLKQSPLNGMVIRENAKRIILAFQKKLIVLDLNDGSILWQYSSDKKGESFISVDVSPNGKFMACGININLKTQAKNSKSQGSCLLYVWDIDGQAIGSMEFKSDSCAGGLPVVKFSADKNTITVETKETLHFIEIY